MRGQRLESRILIVLALVVGAACSNGGVPVDPGIESMIPSNAVLLSALEVDTLASEWSSDMARHRSAILTEEAWAEFWAALYNTRTPKPALPEVDFETHMVLAAGLGGRPSSGYSINIDGIYRTDSRMYVVVRESLPPTCLVLTVITSPVIAVQVPRFDGDVSFLEETVRRRSCT